MQNKLAEAMKKVGKKKKEEKKANFLGQLGKSLKSSFGSQAASLDQFTPKS